MEPKRNEIRCQARTKNGKPCRAAAMAGGLCFLHANPNKAAELGRIGGQKNRHIVDTSHDPFPPLKSALALRETVARLVGDAFAGTITPRVVSCVTPLLSLQLKAIKLADHEERIKELERLAAEENSKGDSPPIN